MNSWDGRLGTQGHATRRYAGPDEAGSDPPSDNEHEDDKPDSQAREPGQGKHPYDEALAEPKAKAPRVRFHESPEEIASQAGHAESSAGANRPPPFNASVSGGVEITMDNAIVAEHGPLELEASSRPSKQQRLNAVHEQHEDELLEFSFAGEELEGLETYDRGLEDEDLSHDDSDLVITEEMKSHLVFPYDVQEPNLTEDELRVLDALADKVEVERLQSMGVLTDAETLLAKCPDSKCLSTRFVRTWRDKSIDERHVYLRRSRLVAREYAWIDQRTDLFSPASSAIGSRLLPTLFMRNRADGYLLGAIDVGDAFLTVPQREPTVATAVDSMGVGKTYALGKVLPGQRAGSQWWYESITSLLCQELDMTQCGCYPNLLGTKDGACTILLHVDDMLVCAKDSFIDNRLIPMLEKHHKISSAFIRNVGDEMAFLKRSHRLVSENKMVISSHPRHVEQLLKLMGAKPTSRPKRVPGQPLMDEEDNTEELNNQEASQYRSCVGILLYLANDLPHCQHCIRHLSAGMSKPTKRLKDILRHLVSFLYGTRDICLCVEYKGDNAGVHHSYLEEPDSDWASNKKTRRSVSAGYLCLGGALLYSSSRTHRVVSLSSAEAEVYAACSAACDAILVAQMLTFCTGLVVVCHHLIDSAAGRGIISRQGVGRVRRMSCRILWMQDLIKRRSMNNVKKDPHNTESIHIVSGVIAGSKNVADLGTKRLGKKRLLELLLFCNIGHLEEDQFVPVVSEQDPSHPNMVSLVRALKMSPNSSKQIIAQLLLLSALSPGAMGCAKMEFASTRRTMRICLPPLLLFRGCIYLLCCLVFSSWCCSSSKVVSPLSLLDGEPDLCAKTIKLTRRSKQMNQLQPTPLMPSSTTMVLWTMCSCWRDIFDNTVYQVHIKSIPLSTSLCGL